MGQSPAMQCDCPAAFFLLGIEHNERVCLWHHWLGPLASERRGRAPAEQAEERVMLSNEHKSNCASFVIGLPTCPRRKCCRFSGHALVATCRFG